MTGIISNVDMDVMYRDLVNDIKNSKVNNHQTNNIQPSHNEPVYYIIQQGDTLSGISQKFNTSVDVLARLNNIKNVNLIYAGSKIRIK